MLPKRPVPALRTVALAAALVCAGSATAAPVYLGSAARAGVSAEDRTAIDAAMVRALRKYGIPVVDTSSLTEGTAGKASALANSALEDATRAYNDEDWAAVLEHTAAGIAAYERGPAFSGETVDIDLGRDLFSVRALAALKLKERVAAEDAARSLLILQPKYEPNRKKAPKPLVKLFDEVRDELLTIPPAQLEVKSKPPGAAVIVDGRRRGKTPLLLEDLLPGTHYVAVDAKSEGRYTEKIVLKEEGGRVQAKLGGKRQALARDVLLLVERPVGAKKLIDAASDAGNDVVVAVLLPAGKDTEVIAGRVADGEVVSVFGTRMGPLENDRDRGSFVLARAIAEETGDKWLDKSKGQNPKELRDKLFSGTGTREIEDEDTSVSPALIAVGVIGGVIALAAAGGGATVFFLREQRKDEGFTWSADASGL